MLIKGLWSLPNPAIIQPVELNYFQQSKSFLLMCRLHKQIVNELPTTDLHLSKAKKSRRKRGLVLPQPQPVLCPKASFIKKCFKSRLFTQKPDSNIMNEKFAQYLALISLTNVYYHYLSDAVWGTPKWAFCILIKIHFEQAS